MTRVALSVDGTVWRRWHQRCLDRLVAAGAEPVALSFGSTEPAIPWVQLARGADMLAEEPRPALPPTGGGAEVILHLGFGPPAPSSPTWTFLPSWDACAAALATGRDVAEVALVAGDDVLRHATVKVPHHSYARALDMLLAAAAEMPAQVCRGGPLPGPRPPVPAPPQTVPFLARLGWGALTSLRDFLAEEVWTVGTVDAPVASLLEGRPPVRWLPERPGGFLADPFALPDGDVILAEEYDNAAGKGVISALGTGAPRTVLSAPEHMAYPYLLQHGGEIYCIPDALDTHQVPLYRAVEYPQRWERCAPLLSGVSAADATVFRHEGRWWLLHAGRTDMEPAGDLDIHATLHAWYANNLDGPWQPHARNPVKVDVRSSRPAGAPFVHDGTLYRPAQDCSRRYGGAVWINRVDVLTPTAFAETPVRRIDPWAPYGLGVHTLSAAGNRTLVDGKRRALNADHLRGRLRYIAQRLHFTAL